MNQLWKSGSSISYSIKEVLETIRDYKPEKIFIGCDSQPVKTELIFALAICLVHPHKGARFWTRRTIEPRSKYPALSIRLIEEVSQACLLGETVRKETGLPVTIHADINPSPKHPSNKVVRQIVSYIKAMDFDYAIKPDSWASFTVADRMSK